MSNTAKHIARLLLLFPLFVTTTSIAQEDPSDSPEAPPAEEAPTLLKGDIIHLKAGTTMSGVQVLRSTPMYLEIQLVEGVDPLLLPRTQIDYVEYDDIDPARDRLRREIFPEQEEVSLASGEVVTRALMDKLNAPVSDEPLKYQRADFAEVLQEIAKSMEVKLNIHPSIKKLDAGKRRWTFETLPETTLMSLLTKELVGKFDYADVIFRVDTIIVLTKDAAKKQRERATKENK